MHTWAKQIMECVKAKVDGMGMDNLDMENLCEFEKWSCIAKNICEYDYYYNIIKAMEESEYGTDYDYRGKKQYIEHMKNGRRYMHDDMVHDDRMDDWRNGKMHYTEAMPESEYDRTRKAYTESKMLNPTDKAEHLRKINEHIDTITQDARKLGGSMSNEERTTMKQRFINLANEF